MIRKKLLAEFLSICKRKDYRAAIEFQDKIKNLIPGKPARKKIRNICGLDISFDKGSERVFAAASVHSFPDLAVIEQKGVTSITEFPYIPGLLAFREGPAIIELLEKLKSPIDLFLFDGQGIAHPRGAGIASMMGLLLDKPSIGCAKTRLVGGYDGPASRKGASSRLTHNGMIIGSVLRTRDNVKPVFVSVGYKIDLKISVDSILKCCRKYRIPEPIREAHRLSNQLRTESNIN
ncbi:MAG: endonuclease V [Candidatus Zixiibacteriota bacterium]|nr:MAG: endonuclease V [candidate division Zixibacteria bacterium]